MGKVAGVKRGRGGRSRSKGKDSDDSDEDYLVEEDEDYIDEEDEEKLFSNEEDADDDENGEDIGEQYYNDSSDNNIELEDMIEEEELSTAARLKRKRSGLEGKKLGTRAFNNKRNAVRRQNESDDDNETQTESFQAAEEVEMNEVTISKRKRSCLNQKKSRSKPSSNRRNFHQEFDDDDYNVEEEEEEDGEDEDQTQEFRLSEEVEEVDEVIRPNPNRSCFDQKTLPTKTSNPRRNGLEKVDDEDYNFDDEEEDDEDDEFTLDESFSSEEYDDEEEEEHVVKKKKQSKKVSKRTSRTKSSGFRKRKKRRVKIGSKVGKKRKESRSLRRNVGSDEDGDGDDCEDEDFSTVNFVRRRTKKKSRGGARNFTVHSDSDILESGPSETEFTISEEEREQVREASNICRKSAVSLRSSCSKIQENESFAQKTKPFVKKGKEKIPELKNEAVKQVCGICFTEEGKNTMRGALNCCSHYFCFACILEWSKVESRCPLCKQRFQSISKSAKGSTGVDLRDVVLQIPERDQVYQPTEEEIRGYIDPYENVICTECREGGDDELMLLCDLCDSPAHTYCVGLGREVPEGNWYCEGCRPASFGPSNDQIQDTITGQRNLFHRLSSFENVRDDFDGSFSTPSTPFPQGFGSFPSPRYLGGGIQASSPRSGTGVVTVSGRRQIHRQIQSMFSNNRSRQATDALIGNTVNDNQVSQSLIGHRASSPTRTPEIGTSLRGQLYEESRNMHAPQNMHFVPVGFDRLAGQLVLDTTPVLDYINIQGTSRPSSISASHNVQPIMLSNSTNLGCDYHPSSFTLGEASNFYLEEQVKRLVQDNLTSMSSTLTILDAGVLEEIGRKSSNTILAACGYHRHPTDVFPMPSLPICCTHIENPLILTSPIKGHCSSCFNNFAKEVVKTIMNSKLPSFLHIRN